ncbi:MAG: DoxX family protein [Gemmatimonadales bacterium]
MNQVAVTALARWGLVPLRVVVGVVFLMHGGQKLFVYGFGGTAGAMAQMGIPLPELSAIVVSLVEFFGGLAIFLGLFTRWAAPLLAIDMAVAILAVRLPGGFFAPSGFELELTLFAAALTLAALGSGGMSVDQVLERRKAG